MEALIKAGVLESCGHSRQGLLLVAAKSLTKLLTEEADMGIQTLFGELDDTNSSFDERIEVPEDEVDERTMLAWEKKCSVYTSQVTLYMDLMRHETRN